MWRETKKREALAGPSGDTKMYLEASGITKTQLRRGQPLQAQHETAGSVLFRKDWNCMNITSNTNIRDL